MAAMNAKPEGNISSVFPSLSGIPTPELPSRFAKLKASIVHKREDALQESWQRLLPALSSEIEAIREKGSNILPSINYSDIGTLSHETLAEIRHRGCVIIRGVLSQSDALSLKTSAKDYIAANQSKVRAYPPDSPAVYELYWSPPQLRSRAHANVLSVQNFLQSLWHSSDPKSEISTRYPLTYADRFRIRQPGDAKFALGPHCDGGSLERWEDPEYRSVYQKILDGKWEEYDAFDAKHRISAKMDLYNGAGGCSMFRMWQGWLSMSSTGPSEGSLLLNPLLKHSTAYSILRPFFTSTNSVTEPTVSPTLPIQQSTAFPGSNPAAGQEFSPTTHPHLQLKTSMVPIPRVEPGDFVAWHCDTIHAVDPLHRGKSDSSVLYIPATPLCRNNWEYLKRQREAFKKGTPAPDFPGAGGENGEAGFVEAIRDKLVDGALGEEGARAMGVGKVAWKITEDMSEGEWKAVEGGNAALFE